MLVTGALTGGKTVTNGNIYLLDYRVLMTRYEIGIIEAEIQMSNFETLPGGASQPV